MGSRNRNYRARGVAAGETTGASPLSHGRGARRNAKLAGHRVFLLAVTWMFGTQKTTRELALYVATGVWFALLGLGYQWVEAPTRATRRP